MKVSRLGSPYDECFDPSSKNSTRNAYEELYPIEYSETVFYLKFVWIRTLSNHNDHVIEWRYEYTRQNIF